MKVNLVFEGGGVTGISYAGALKALEEKGFEIHRCAGTSAGAIIAALSVAGYTSKELAEEIYKTDFRRFLKKTNIGKTPVLGKPLSIILDKGIYDSSCIEDWIQVLLEKKGVVKFKDVMIEGKSKLKIIAADITRRKMLILPDDLEEYNINPLGFSIARAVAMSSAIPLFFTPYTLSAGDKNNFIVDGGLLSSFPIWIFDVEGMDEYPTLGIKIKDLYSNTLRGKTDLISYVKDMITAPINQDEENFIRDKDKVRTIAIDYDGKVGVTDFDKARDFIPSLYNNGYNSTIRFITSLSFRSYIKLFENNKIN